MCFFPFFTACKQQDLGYIIITRLLLKQNKRRWCSKSLRQINLLEHGWPLYALIIKGATFIIIIILDYFPTGLIFNLFEEELATLELLAKGLALWGDYSMEEFKTMLDHMYQKKGWSWQRSEREVKVGDPIVLPALPSPAAHLFPLLPFAPGALFPNFDNIQSPKISLARGEVHTTKISLPREVTNLP